MKTECVMCGQQFLFPMNEVCSICEDRLQKDLEREQAQALEDHLLDRNTNDQLPPFFPWGVKENKGFEAHRLGISK